MSFKYCTMSTNYKTINNLRVSEELLSFVNNELLKDTEITPKKFWLGFDEAVHSLVIQNQDLLKIRETIQKKIDGWHLENKIKETNINE